MYCPFCNQHDSRVLESRTAGDNTSIRRRRQCESCNMRFTTFERIESFQIFVVKASGNREPYIRDKLHRGVSVACAKTMVSAQQVDDLIDNIELELQALGKREIASRALGEMILMRLKELNEVAYVRFASVYRQFQSIQDFISELHNLTTAK